MLEAHHLVNFMFGIVGYVCGVAAIVLQSYLAAQGNPASDTMAKHLTAKGLGLNAVLALGGGFLAVAGGFQVPIAIPMSSIMVGASAAATYLSMARGTSNPNDEGGGGGGGGNGGGGGGNGGGDPPALPPNPAIFPQPPLLQVAPPLPAPVPIKAPQKRTDKKKKGKKSRHRGLTR